MTESGTDLVRIRSVIERGMRLGWHVGGTVVVDRAAEHLSVSCGSDGWGRDLTPATVMPWLCAAKPLLILAVAQLWDDGRLTPWDPVSQHLPVEASGRSASYLMHHPWFVMGAVIERIGGRPLEQALRGRVLRPCGMGDTYVAVPSIEDARFEATSGMMVVIDEQPDLPPSLNRILDAELVGRVGILDHAFDRVIDFSLGFMVGSRMHDRKTLLFGRHASEHTFGRGGQQSSLGFVDPRHDLSAVIFFNGMPPGMANPYRTQTTASAIYADLGLDG